MTITFTEQDEKFIAAFREVVQEHGQETTYLRPADTLACMYVHNRGQHNETPGCVFGYVHQKMFGEVMPKNREGLNIANVLILQGDYAGISFPVADAARSAQGLQDDGADWGTALTRFEHVLGLTLTREPATVEV